MKYSDNLFDMIERDPWMMEVLRAVGELGQKDCWIGAGFIRNKVWDVLHDFDRTELNDVDVVYFNAEITNLSNDYLLENKLKGMISQVNWSVKNQARMHIQNNHAPYKNCEDAIAHWPETATAVAVRLTDNLHLEVIAPYGLMDLFHLYLRRSPLGSEHVFKKRMEEKQWMLKWPRLILK